MLRVVIVGSSVAGVRTAQSLRNEGFDGEIVLIGDEPELPYDKPELSKRLLEGSIAEAENILLTEDAAEAAGIELRLGQRADSLNRADRQVVLADGSTIDYDTLVIATGARARRSPWGEPVGVHVLRTIADARGLARDLTPGAQLVIVGGGFIGSEVASTAIKLGVTVDIVDSRPVPMARALGSEIGTTFSDIHSRNSVSTHFGNGATNIAVDESRTAPSGRPGLAVTLEDGTVLQADSVVVGIGVIPNTEWLQGSGLDLEGGVVCDQFLRASGANTIYAVGDLARWWHPRHGHHMRLEHWTSAVEQARAVAFNVLHPHEPKPFSPVEYIWSDQYGSRFQFAGRTGGPVHMIVRDPVDASRYAVAFSEDGVIYSGVMTANWPKALIMARQLVESGAPLAEVHARLERTLVGTPIAAAGA